MLASTSTIEEVIVTASKRYGSGFFQQKIHWRFLDFPVPWELLDCLIFHGAGRGYLLHIGLTNQEIKQLLKQSGVERSTSSPRISPIMPDHLDIGHVLRLAMEYNVTIESLYNAYITHSLEQPKRHAMSKR